MSKLLDCPDSILVLICRQLPLLDLYRLRLTNRKLAGFVPTHGKEICPSSAECTFPGATRLLTIAQIHGRDYRWMNDLPLRWLAAFMVDKFRIESKEAFGKTLGFAMEPIIDDSYDDELEGKYAQRVQVTNGDAVRQRVFNGLTILRELSRISKGIRRVPEDELEAPSEPVVIKHFVPPQKPSLWARLFPCVKKYDGPQQSSPLDLVMDPVVRKLVKNRKEMAILDRRTKYLEKLGQQQIRDFRFMMAILHYMIKTKPHSEYEPNYFDWGNKEHDFRQGRSWLNWWILHHGPVVFWAQWYTQASESYVRAQALFDWGAMTMLESDEQRAFAVKLEEALAALAGEYYNPFASYGDQPGGYFPPGEIWEFTNYMKKYAPGPPVTVPEKKILTDCPHGVLFLD